MRQKIVARKAITPPADEFEGKFDHTFDANKLNLVWLTMVNSTQP